MANGTTDDGLSAGGFIFKPAVAISEEYSDNIYTEDRNEDGDFVTRIKPSLVIDKVDKKKTQLRVTLDAEQVMYADDSDNDYLNYHAGLRTKYVFNPLTSWDVSADYRHYHSERGDNDADPAAVAEEPLVVDRINARTSMTRKFADFSVTPRLAYVHYNYKDGRRVNGTVIDQDVRDRDEYTGGARMAYDIDDKTQLFVDGEAQAFRYDQDIISDRDSDGGDYLLGVRYRPNNAVTAEIAGGYMYRNYDNTALENIGTWDANVRVEWEYADGSKIKFTAGRSIVETTDATVGGAVSNNVTASLEHALTQDMIGKLDLRYSHRTYEGGFGSTSGTEDREDDYYKVGLSTEYMITQFLSLIAGYSYADNDSNLDTADYAENVFMLTVKAGF